MKIVIFVGEFFSLSQTFILRKVKALAQRGEAITVVSFGNSGSKAHEEIIKDVENVQVIQIPPDSGTLLHRLRVWAFLSFRALMRSPKDTILFWGMTRRYSSWKLRLKQMRKLLGLVGIRGDVYHFEFGDLAASYIDYIKSVARPCIVSFRGSDINTYPVANIGLEKLYRELILHVDRIHCTSKAIAGRVSQLGASKKHFVNYPAIDADYYSPTNNSVRDPNLIVSVGRLKWVKGYPFALLAISKVVSDFPALHYLIIGDGPDKDELAFYVENLGIQKNVVFFGQASGEDVKKTLARASVFLLSSISEGVSNAVLEAMAMEVSVVTTDAGGMAEAVSDGVEGFIVPRYDPEAIAEKIRLLLCDNKLRERMGQAGRQRILQEFTIERQTKVFMNEYSTLYKSYRV